MLVIRNLHFTMHIFYNRVMFVAILEIFHELWGKRIIMSDETNTLKKKNYT